MCIFIEISYFFTIVYIVIENYILSFNFMTRVSCNRSNDVEIVFLNRGTLGGVCFIDNLCWEDVWDLFRNDETILIFQLDAIFNYHGMGFFFIIPMPNGNDIYT